MQHCLGKEGLTVKDNTLVSLALQSAKGLGQLARFLSVDRKIMYWVKLTFVSGHAQHIFSLGRTPSGLSLLMFATKIECTLQAIGIVSNRSQVKKQPYIY